MSREQLLRTVAQDLEELNEVAVAVAVHLDCARLRVLVREDTGRAPEHFHEAGVFGDLIEYPRREATLPAG